MRRPDDRAAAAQPRPDDPFAPIVTERLLLRPWHDDEHDLDAYARICADAEVMRYIGRGVTLNRLQAAEQLAGFVAHWREHGFGLRAAIARDSDELIGFVGVARAGQPGVRPGDVEIGWRLARDRWGHGYATEGALAVRDHAFQRLRLARLVAFVRPRNSGSINVMGKLGMALEKEALCSHEMPMRIYALDNPLAAHDDAARPDAPVPPTD
ncbi:GNAT family N-acetyltransferase [Conexibacter stalactiti]|uniref:GNAT family N-acetyltransferase n=1 Tax=Conexibacter stalactiti TaxID=1940611 RepID=A0ABU4HR57_9ACTN|nr:GNAT family N-acetyltransferase [Conexibacter stalactiti]MDW5594544.1 GNAT family N-acetyltransferase [Conexibacter stalactiti]MEC5035186.1 GNAT family N-acetyltransferase [Conexibacter stalactiti]